MGSLDQENMYDNYESLYNIFLYYIAMDGYNEKTQQFHDLLLDLKNRVRQNQFYSILHEIVFPINKRLMFQKLSFDDIKYEFQKIYSMLYTTRQKQYQVYIRLINILLSFFSQQSANHSIHETQLREGKKQILTDYKLLIEEEMITSPRNILFDELIGWIQEILGVYYDGKKALIQLFFNDYIKQWPIDDLLDDILLDDFEHEFSEDEKVLVLENLKNSITKLHNRTTIAGVRRRKQTNTKMKKKRQKTMRTMKKR